MLVTLPAGPVRDSFFTKSNKASLAELGDVEYNPYSRQLTTNELKESLGDKDVVFTGWGTPQISCEVLEKADKLQIIAHTGGTVASIVSDEVFRRNLIVLSGNSVFAESVAEGCLCYAMASQRNLCGYVRQVQNGLWRDSSFQNNSIWYKTVGLVGFGMVAKQFVQLLKPFQCRIKVYSGHLTQEEADGFGLERASLEELFETCDIISVHSALTERNYHLIGSDQLKRMKDDALLINTSRGAVIDEMALISELATGRIRAALDVFEQEPLPEHHILRNLPNVMSMPHMAGPTIDMRAVVVEKLIADLLCHSQGKTGKLACQITKEYVSNQSRG